MNPINTYQGVNVYFATVKLSHLGVPNCVAIELPKGIMILKGPNLPIKFLESLCVFEHASLAGTRAIPIKIH